MPHHKKTGLGDGCTAGRRVSGAVDRPTNYAAGETSTIKQQRRYSVPVFRMKEDQPPPSTSTAVAVGNGVSGHDAAPTTQQAQEQEEQQSSSPLQALEAWFLEQGGVLNKVRPFFSIYICTCIGNGRRSIDRTSHPHALTNSSTTPTHQQTGARRPHQRVGGLRARGAGDHRAGGGGAARALELLHARGGGPNPKIGPRPAGGRGGRPADRAARRRGACPAPHGGAKGGPAVVLVALPPVGSWMDDGGGLLGGVLDESPLRASGYK